MNLRRESFFAIVVVTLLALSGTFFVVVNFASTSFSSEAYAPSGTVGASGSLFLNQSSSEIPISLPTGISLLADSGRRVPPATLLSLDVVISSRNPIGLSQYVNEVSSPLSSKYHRYISPQQYSLLYGPDTSEVNSLSSYFSSKGLVTTIDEADPNILHVSGSALNVESALSVSIDSFRTLNSSFYSPLSMPRLPTRFSSFVQTIYGLSNYGNESQSFAQPMYRTFGEISPGQADDNNIYYSPSEMRQIYNSSSLLSAGYNGTGVTIAIVDAFGDPYIQQELDNFSAQFNLPNTTVHQICVDGPCDYAEGISEGWQPEIALDVEWAHAMAPGADINLYIGSNNSFPIFDAVEAAVSNGSNSIISMSWGSPENTLAASSPVAPIEGESYPWLDEVLQQAAAEGITAFTSAGDYGAYDQGAAQSLPYGGPEYPSTDPYVTSVGGTSLYMNTTSGTLQFPYSNATGSYGYETAWSWSDQWRWGTGGGYSSIFSAPPWQHGTGFDSRLDERGAPDVAWDADPATGVAIALFDPSAGGVEYFVEGGTSVGSPSWAGSLATIEQKVGYKLGLITPELYSIFNDPSDYAKAFHDITQGNNNPLSAGVGWSPLTGIGSPNLGELANYLAPTGALEVAVTNSLSGNFASSFAYGSQVELSANVTDGGSVVSSGPVVANITAQNGQVIATGVQLSFNSAANEWTGSYSIKSTDPPGEWSANVLAIDGSLSGWGSTTFSVGDGIDIYSPIFNVTTLASATPVFTVGQTINVTAKVTSPDGACCVTSGNYSVSFNENSPTGKREGRAPLSYNATSDLWVAQYKIPLTVDQDSWAMTVSGKDSSGNSGSAYNWLYVGLNMNLETDSPTYVLGDTMSIRATPEYTSGLEATTGNFTAVVSAGASVLASIPLALNPTLGYWQGNFPLTTSSPTGYYLITVQGSDGRGSAGTEETIVRVAPFNLSGSISIPSPSVSVNGGSEPMVSAEFTYPNGTTMTRGSVDAFVYLDHDGFHYPTEVIRLTYDSSVGSFVGPDLLPPSSPSNTSIGRYYVNVVAFDGQGDYANLSSSFFVHGESHAAISITDDSGFSPTNGVVAGNGTGEDPYVFAGWNTSSISISGNESTSYEIFNDWVSGASGDGIYLNTPSAAESLVEFTYANSNGGNGIEANGVPGLTLIADEADNNSQNGILVTNGSTALPGEIGVVVANGNTLSGVDIENAPRTIVEYSAASGDGTFGFYLSGIANSTLSYNNATRDAVGIYVTGDPGSSYGQIRLFFSILELDRLGLEVNGLGQNITVQNSSSSSQVIAELNLIENDTVGVTGANDSEIGLEGNTIGFNGVGVVYRNSVAAVESNVIAQNNGSALEIAGAFSGVGGCQVIFANSSSALYSSCVSGNYISLNGNSSSSTSSGIFESGINGTLIEGNLVSDNDGYGLYLSKVNGSSIVLNGFNNDSSDGIYGSALSNSSINENNASSDLMSGIALANANANQLDKNNLSTDSLDGILISSSDNDTITRNMVTSVGSGCAGSCQFAGGVYLANGSDSNAVTDNSISNSRVAGKVGAGIVLSGGAAQNLVYQNNATEDDAGIVISDSPVNTVSGNYLSSDTYGIYLVGSSSISLVSNTLVGDRQELYPNQPIVSFTGIRNGTSVSGVVKISWNSTGQEISNQSSISIDGNRTSVSAESYYAWNSTALPDGVHVITVEVSNGAGQNASATLFVTTTNHEFLAVETIGPDNVPISNSMVTLKNATFSSSAATDSSGRALFHGLAAGSYNASTLINGTAVNSPVSYSANSTVVLFVPTLVTTAQAMNSSGGSVPISVDGNLTASQLSSVRLQNGNGGGYLLTFTVSGTPGTRISAMIGIPKSSTGTGFTPLVTGGGNETTTGQDASNYYAGFIASIPANGTQSVKIDLSPGAFPINVRDLIIIVVVIAIMVAGLVIALRERRPNRSYYLPSQQPT